MTLDWNSILPAFAAGLIASVISPWINWRIEKVRLLHQSRKEKIEHWRRQLEEACIFDRVRCTLLWEELKPHITEVERRRIEEESAGDNWQISKLLGVVAKIQKEWGLI